MAFSDEHLDYIYDRTDGRCHICGGGLSRCNYARLGERGAWEVEHSNPRAQGGTNRLNNLYAAHIDCNRSKGARTTRSARACHGRTCAPMSAAQREDAHLKNALAGGLLGLLMGLRAGPFGAVVGAILGAVTAYNVDPEEELRIF